MSKSVKSAPQAATDPELEPVTATKARSRIAVATRFGNEESEADGRRQLAESKIAACIEKELAKAPKLTPNQISRLTLLLRAGGERQAETRLTRSGVQR